METEIDLAMLRQTFVTETNEHLEDFEGALIDLEARPNDRELLQRIFRIAHTLKGTAGSLGLHALSDLGHALEDIIEDFGRNALPITSTIITLLLEAVDAARQMLPDALTGAEQTRQEQKDVLRKLKAARQASWQGPSSAPPSLTAPRSDVQPYTTKTLRVDVDKLDRMAELIAEIAVNRTRIVQRAREVGGHLGFALLEDTEELEHLHAQLEDAIRRARMVPVGPWFRQYERTVRDVARTQGKMVRLVVEGGDVEVDTAVIERLRDALTHLIRNAVDHGIEPPEIRRANGKDASGTISLRAVHQGEQIVLQISDDGGGMNRALIVARAQLRGHKPEKLPEEQLYALVFEPGFSTAASVSHVSGRGVGLDIVRRRVESLEGSIRVESNEGVGTSFVMRLPLTLATIEGFSVTAGEDGYVIPLRSVVECHDLPRGVFPEGAWGVIQLRGRALPCLRLRALFRLGGTPPAKERVVVVQEGQLVGLVVDELQGEGRTVIKPLGRFFRGADGIAGSTILGDGRVALILDVATLLRAAARVAARPQGLLEASQKVPTI